MFRQLVVMKTYVIAKIKQTNTDSRINFVMSELQNTSSYTVCSSRHVCFLSSCLTDIYHGCWKQGGWEGLSYPTFQKMNF